MALVTLRPNALVSSNEASVTGGTAEAVTADNSDITYLNFPDSGYLKMYHLAFTTTSVPANAIVQSVTPRVRHNSTTVPDLTRTMQLFAGGRSFPVETLNYTGLGSFVTQQGAARTTRPDGRYWTQSDIDSLELELRFQLTPAYRPAFEVAELYVDVVYNEAPTATGTGPNATVGTTRPTFTWSYSDPEGDQQERFIVKVFSSAVYTAPDFDPDNSPYVATSGEVYSSATSWQCSVNLENDKTYRAYIWVADRGSDGRYNTVTAAGPYAYATPHIVELASPMLEVVAPLTPTAAVELTISGRDNHVSEQGADFEATTSLAEWAASGTNCTAARVTSGASSGTASVRLTASALGDIEYAMTHSSSSISVDSGDWFAALTFKVATGSSVMFQVLLQWLAADGTLLDVTEGPAQWGYPSPTNYVRGYVRGHSIYAADVARVAVGIRVLSAASGQQFNIDSIQLSPNPINQVPSVDRDTNNDGVPDGWSVVNTGGDPAPSLSLDRSKVFEGVASWKISFAENDGLKGGQTYVPVAAYGQKLIQVWVAITVEGVTDPAPIVEVRHDALPWATIDVSNDGAGLPADGEFHPITMQLTNTGSSGGTEMLQIVTGQGGDLVTMWIGGVAVIEPSRDPTDYGDYGAANWLGSESFGGPHRLALTSGPFSHGGVVSSHHYELQRSLDNGVTWTTMSRVGTNPDDWQVSDLTTVAPDSHRQTLSAYDFEAPPGTVRYRARSIASLPSSDVLSSDWSEWIAVTVPRGGWWLKSLVDPSMSVRLWVHSESIVWQSDERSSVNYALGREKPIILSDSVSGEYMPVELSFMDEDHYDAFVALRATQNTFLLQSSYGDHRYVRLVGSSVATFMANGGGIRKRIVKVTIYEVDEP